MLDILAFSLFGSSYEHPLYIQKLEFGGCVGIKVCQLESFCEVSMSFAGNFFCMSFCRKLQFFGSESNM